MIADQRTSPTESRSISVAGRWRETMNGDFRNACRGGGWRR